MQATMLVENPDARRKPFATHYRGVSTYVEPKEFKIRLPRALRNDPFSQMHAHGRVSDLLYQAGLEFQSLKEMLGDRLPSSGDIREFVDGGQRSDGLTDTKLNAGKTIAAIRAEVNRQHGIRGYAVLEAVLIAKLNVRQCAQRYFGGATKANELFAGRYFRDVLTTVAKELGLA